MLALRRALLLCAAACCIVAGSSRVRPALASPPHVEIVDFDTDGAVVPARPAFAKLGPRIGLEIHTPKTQTSEEIVRQVRLAHELGFGFVRTDLFWARVETVADRYDFSSFDPIAETARENGMGVLWTLAFGNFHLYHTPDYGNKNPGDGDAHAFHHAIDHYAAYAAAAAKHFAGSRDVVFEVWNEPDENAALSDPALYEATFLTTLAEMRKADPNVRVSTGGVSHFEAPLLREIVSSPETRGATAIGVHLYRTHNAPETIDADIPSLHAAIAASDDPAARIWDTEWGYSADGDFPPSFGDGHSSAARYRQAVYDVRELLAVWQLGLPLAVLYELEDGGTDAAEREDNFGLIDAAGAPKPAYRAVAQLTSVAASRHLAGRYANLPSGIHAIRLDDDAGTGYAIVLWLADAGRTATIALGGRHDVRATDVLGRPIDLGRSHLVTLSEAAGPIYVTLGRS